VNLRLSTPRPKCGMRELVVYFLRLGLMGFGGPVALVGQMERELVAERKRLTREQMREAVAFHLGRPSKGKRFVRDREFCLEMARASLTAERYGSPATRSSSVAQAFWGGSAGPTAFQ
jgi:Chromate transporter